MSIFSTLYMTITVAESDEDDESLVPSCTRNWCVEECVATSPLPWHRIVECIGGTNP